MAIAPVSRPIAFLSDVHGNLEALEAVLEELSRREIEQIFVAGDLLLGGAEPLEVWRRLTRVGARCTRGPSDTALATIDPSALTAATDDEREKLAAFVKTRDAIGDLVAKELKELPEKIRIPLIDGREIVMSHAAPDDPAIEIGHDMPEEEVIPLVSGDPADVFVVGATHVPFVRVLGEGAVWVVNAGSVGAAPEGRIAHYTILTPKMGAQDVLQDYLEY